MTDKARNAPGLFSWPELAGSAAVFKGDLELAQHYFDQVPSDEYHRLVGEADLLIRRGHKADVDTKLAALRRLYGDTVNYQYAQIYAQLGDRDRAFAALDRAWTFRDGGLGWIRVDPHLDPIRSDPRYAALLKKMNFPASPLMG